MRYDPGSRIRRREKGESETSAAVSIPVEASSCQGASWPRNTSGPCCGCCGATPARRSPARCPTGSCSAASAPAAPEDEEAVAWRDLRPLLDEAIDGLPEKYRAPVVLCYLEGKTNEEAARELGCPKGTVAVRLMRARERLRRRLDRRRLLLPAALLGAVLAGRASAAAVEPALAGTTVKAAP